MVPPILGIWLLALQLSPLSALFAGFPAKVECAPEKLLVLTKELVPANPEPDNTNVGTAGGEGNEDADAEDAKFKN